MDGILQGVTSIAPIAPDTSAIAEKGVFKGPPVEIMPLPDNSFNSEGATAEQPGGATVNPNSRYRGRTQDGRQPAAEKGNAGLPGSESPLPYPEAETAYTVTLGEESAGLNPSAAKELAQMKAYQELGRALSRRERGGLRGLLSAEPESAAPSPLGSERAYVSRFFPEPHGAPLPEGDELFEAGGRPGAAAPPGGGGPPTDVQEVSLGQGAFPAAPGEDAGGPAEAPAQPADGIQEDLAAPKVRLGPADFAAIMELEPEQRELLMKMLGLEELMPGDIGRLAEGEIPREPADARERMDEAPGGGLGPPFNLRRRLAGMPIEPRQQAAPADGPEIEAADVRSGGQKAPARPLAPGAEFLAPKAGIENLKKVFELPYALYLFGAVEERRRREAEEEDEAPASRAGRGRRREETPFLKLSEAVKMAAVLHSIYHGGDGRFEEDTPWHAPYVRYAIKNGIIRQGEFDDFNRFATRAEAAHILSRSVPRAELPPVRAVGEMKDVAEDAMYGEGVYLLCRAGVMAPGEDGRFWPDRLMTRAEAVAAAGRIATPSDRIRPG